MNWRDREKQDDSAVLAIDKKAIKIFDDDPVAPEAFTSSACRCETAVFRSEWTCVDCTSFQCCAEEE